METLDSASNQFDQLDDVGHGLASASNDDAVELLLSADEDAMGVSQIATDSHSISTLHSDFVLRQ